MDFTLAKAPTSGTQGRFYLGLIVEQKLVGLERLAQVVFHGGAGIDGSLQGRGEEAQGIASRRLGLIHGDVCLLHDFAQALLVTAEDRDANARSAEAFVAIEQVGLANCR